MARFDGGLGVGKVTQNSSMSEAVWLFGYGSLIFKTDFPFIDRKPASIYHWVRRFWQGSHDHRGTQTAPGRVVTLIPAENAECAGVAYLVSPDVFEDLDYREKNGYSRLQVSINFLGNGSSIGVVYIAMENNPAFLGPAGESEIAKHIFHATGPSGRNSDYLLELATALRSLAIDDPHVFEVEKYLLALKRQTD